MRTRVTLDKDQTEEVERVRLRLGGTFDEALNHVLRLGLAARSESRPSPIHPLDLGRPLFDVSNTERAISYAEGEDHK
jgi:hypothetical protein